MLQGLCLALLVVGMTACEKEPSASSAPAQSQVSTDGNMLIFESIELFEKTVSDLDDKKQEDFLKQISSLTFNNYFSSAPTPLPMGQSATQEMDEFLGQLLNEDGVIQIGAYLFKIDLKKEQVFVLPTSYKQTDYKDLVQGNLQNQHLMVYSTGDDVLDLLTNPSPEKCGGVGGGTYPCYSQAYQGQIVATVGGGIVWRLNPGVKFFRAGIYFRLSSLYDIWAYPNAQATSGGTKVRNISGVFEVEIFCRYPEGWYRKRPCNSGSIGRQSPGFYYREASASHQRTFYSGTRNLNGYYFFVQGRVRYPDGSVTIASPYGGRNVNSPY